MSASPTKAPDTPPDALTPEDLLALVRRSSDKFQKHMPGAPEAEPTGFAPLSFVRETQPQPKPEAEPETAPEEPEAERPDASDLAAESGFSPAPVPEPIDIEA